MTVIFAFAFGLAFGSFANVAIDRIAQGKALGGRSSCDACGRVLRWWELVPVASYIALRGRCGGCGHAIGLRTPAVELACGLVFAALYATTPPPAAVAVFAGLLLTLIACGALLGRRERAHG